MADSVNVKMDTEIGLVTNAYPDTTVTRMSAA